MADPIPDSEQIAALLARNEELERRLRENAAKLERSDAELDALAYSVSHDLKAPLWAIAGFGEILAADHRASLTPEAQKHLDLILQSTAKMTRLFDDLVKVARLGKKTKLLQPLNLREMIEQVVASHAERIKASSAQIALPEQTPEIVADRALLTQIFDSLLDNALKYRKKDVPPKIVFSVREEPEQIVVCVADNGIGVPEKYREQIFNVFKRLHTEKEYAGTGVGLAIVRKAAHVSGGSAWCEGNPDGSTFCVKMPKNSSSVQHTSLERPI